MNVRNLTDATRTRRLLVNFAVTVSGALVLAVFIWQAVTSQGNPDPTASNISQLSVVLNTGILVFREGLEAILVLAALTASLVRTKEGHWKPVALGAGASFVASVITWFVVVAIISSLNAPALHVQAATGLLAIGVLLIIMNWFFHKIYWAGWINLHNRRRAALTQNTTRTQSAIFRGLFLVGFTSVYREGFEVVLFLQSMRLKAGSHVVLEGVSIGLALTLIVAWLTFIAHYRLPYKRMLVLTGVLLGAVLLVMVGESVQEMQQAGWISTTTLPFHMPDWLNLWLAVYPSAESLLSQTGAAVFVIGSYLLARRACKRPAATDAEGPHCIVPDCNQCDIQNSQESPVQVTYRQTNTPAQKHP